MDPAQILEQRIAKGQSTIVMGDLPPLPSNLTLVRVICDVAMTLGPLERAREKIQRVLDGESARERDLLGARARHRPIADERWRPTDVAFVDACNRLAARAHGRAALVLERIDLADSATLRMLAGILRSDRLKLPLILVIENEPKGAFAEVAAALSHHVDGSPKKDPAMASGSVPPAGVSEDVLRVLRAGAVVGETFDATIVAALLETPIDRVLEALQRARDVGLSIVDRGDGVFSLGKEMREVIASSVLPSLRSLWHRRIAQLVTPERRDPLKAATHLEAAGDRELALEKRLEAVESQLRHGEAERAGEALEAVHHAIDSLPATPARARLAARAALERARIQWLGVGHGPSFSLGAALDHALAARALLSDDAPAKLRADLTATIAGIAYDLGETGALSRAFRELTETIELLLRDGATMEAAGLLNDEAAIELRYGHTRRARQLLTRSQELFAGMLSEKPDDRTALAELADTHHILARLPLHEGQSDAVARQLAIDSAMQALEIFRQLGLRRDGARVLDTLARLEAMSGEVEKAREHFTEALRAEDTVADLTGLARSTAGLASLLASCGKPSEAIGLLASSIELNREKGSRIGLAFDERALSEIEAAVGKMSAPTEELEAELGRARESLGNAMRESLSEGQQA